MGPYGLGRAPSPLMHTPSGCAYGCPAGAPIIGRDYFSFLFVARPPFGLPALMGALKGTHMCTPPGCTLYNACTRVREAHCNFGQNSRSLGQNYRQGLFVKINGHTSWASMHFVHMGTPIGPPIPLRGEKTHLMCWWWHLVAGCGHPLMSKLGEPI